MLVLFAAAIVLSARRDVGEGLLASRDVAPPRAFGLGSPFGLALRLELGALLAWCIGAAAAAFALGTIAKVTTGSLPKSLGDTLDKFGVKGAFANQYFGVAFLLVATLVALLAAGQIGSASEEETSGRSVHVLAQPVDRAVLFLGRVALAAGAIVAAGLLAGLGAWVGAKTQGVDLRLGSMLGAGLNVVPDRAGGARYRRGGAVDRTETRRGRRVRGRHVVTGGRLVRLARLGPELARTRVVVPLHGARTRSESRRPRT